VKGNKMELTIRTADITIHICSHCGEQIIGDFISEEINGCKTYRHPEFCPKKLSNIPTTGTPRPLFKV
jgi:hypothetical protein